VKYQKKGLPPSSFDNFMNITYSPCLPPFLSIASKITRLSPSPLAGEGGGEGETYHVHPHLNPPPSRGRLIPVIFMVRE